jgi:hypothetical protein
MMRMRTLLLLAAAAVSGTTALGLGVSGSEAQQRPEPKPRAPKNSAPKNPEPTTACIKVTISAPYRAYGYDHIVQLTSTCSTPQTCRVKTDANPVEVEQSVPAGESREVLTFRGSPAAAFTPTVSCKEAG